jgi:hypothetical protein
MAAVMPVLVADAASPAEHVEPHPLAEQARARLARWWPGLVAAA